MITALSFLALGLLSTNDGTADWPQFLGPNADGKVPMPDINFEWSEDGPPVAWAFQTGVGYGGVAVRDGEVFLLDRESSEGDILRVLDLESGEEKWSVAYEAPGRLSFPGSRSVPTVTEKYVYTCGGQSQVACFDREKHELVWLVDMEKAYDGIEPQFGWSAAPLLVGDVLIVTPLGAEVGLLGLNALTGEELWVTAGVGRSHSTPRLLNLLGKSQVLFISSKAERSSRSEASPTLISSFDPQDGSLIWSTETPGASLPIPGITQVGDDRFFMTGGYRGGSSMMRIKETEGEYQVEVLFHIERGAQIHHPLLHEDHLYVLVNENWNNDRRRREEGGLLCLDLDGKEIWRTADDPYFGRGNALLLGDHLVIQDGFNGTLRVAKATPKGYEQLAEANIFGVFDRRYHQMWAPMAIAGKKLLLRSQDELLCVDL